MPVGIRIQHKGKPVHTLKNPSIQGHFLPIQALFISVQQLVL
jgi:hypothetical protein